jgi:phosphoribosyl-AMP cyclohydrolase
MSDIESVYLSRIRSASRDDRNEVERGLSFAPKFDANGLITVVTTDADSGDVLMVAYMNDEALAKTMAIGEAVYYSRSRQEIWHKGATSGEFQTVVEMRVDCDQDAIVLKVKQQGGGCCHVGYPNCFFRSVAIPAGGDADKPLPLAAP